MNIFYLSADPEECARYHNDKHVVKMILEYAQLLSTSHRVLDSYTGDHIYKQTHTNHPSAVWVRGSVEHYNWLVQLWKKLMEEYTYRYHKVHKTSRLIDFLEVSPTNISADNWTNPPCCMPVEYIANTPVQSYRNYYIGHKRKFATWKRRETPKWFVEGTKSC